MTDICIGAIKLVIWDLDDTFWEGTLSEGPILVVEKNCQYVKDLARYNIKNSICSKNDFEPCQYELERCNVWSLFEVPSINWNPKAPRVRDILNTLHIHPSKALFIDDKESNLNEVKELLPSIHVLNSQQKNHFLDTLIDYLSGDENIV